MKSVLISIQPKWCELIASGKKTVEVRKTKPKLDTPFKVYIYATKSGDRLVLKNDKVFEISKAITGKVIGEFVCDMVLDFGLDPYGHNSYFISDDDFESTCFTLFDEFWEYGKGKPLYGWHISDLVIYDKPKELSEFYKPCYYMSWCQYKLLCDAIGYDYFNCGNCENVITRPPQSWCYVEELG